MPKDILNMVFAPKKFSDQTHLNDILTWKDCRKRMLLYYNKPFLIGNPSFIVPPRKDNIEYPKENEPLRKIISLWWGDITKCNIESIVNSANIKLKSGGGVCGVIHRASGNQLSQECFSKYPNGLMVTQCGITNAYNIPCKYIIHAVGPAQVDWSKLSKTYKNVLDCCIQNGIRQVCFCCIGCGTHQLPIKKASMVAIHSCIKFLTETHKFDDSKQNNDCDEKGNSNDTKNDCSNLDTIVENHENDDNGDDVENEVSDQVNGKKDNDIDVNDGNVETEQTKDNLNDNDHDLQLNDEDNKNKKELKKGYEYFDRIVFNCWKELEIDCYKNWLTSELG